MVDSFNFNKFLVGSSIYLNFSVDQFQSSWYQNFSSYLQRKLPYKIMQSRVCLKQTLN